MNIWQEAIRHVVYISNIHWRLRKVRPMIEWKSPFELLWGKKPRFSKLHRFGQVGYLPDNSPPAKKPKSYKFRPRAHRVIYLGHAENQKAFKVYDSKSKKIYSSVQFDYDSSATTSTRTIDFMIPAQAIEAVPGVVDDKRSMADKQHTMSEESDVNFTITKRVQLETRRLGSVSQVTLYREIIRGNPENTEPPNEQMNQNDPATPTIPPDMEAMQQLAQVGPANPAVIKSAPRPPSVDNLDDISISKQFHNNCGMLVAHLHFPPIFCLTSPHFFWARKTSKMPVKIVTGIKYFFILIIPGWRRYILLCWCMEGLRIKT